jgi:hypothetical protein
VVFLWCFRQNSTNWSRATQLSTRPSNSTRWHLHTNRPYSEPQRSSGVEPRLLLEVSGCRICICKLGISSRSGFCSWGGATGPQDLPFIIAGDSYLAPSQHYSLLLSVLGLSLVFSAKSSNNGQQSRLDRATAAIPWPDLQVLASFHWCIRMTFQGTHYASSVPSSLSICSPGPIASAVKPCFSSSLSRTLILLTRSVMFSVLLLSSAVFSSLYLFPCGSRAGALLRGRAPRVRHPC